MLHKNNADLVDSTPKTTFSVSDNQESHQRLKGLMKDGNVAGTDLGRDQDNDRLQLSNGFYDEVETGPQSTLQTNKTDFIKSPELSLESLVR